MPEDPDLKAELIETAQNVKREAAKDAAASEKKIAGWLRSIAAMAPDILDVIANTLLNPIAGVATAIKKTAEEAKQEMGQV